jgi:hypothetical protein
MWLRPIVFMKLNTVDEYVANVKDGMLVGKRKTLQPATGELSGLKCYRQILRNTFEGLNY